MTKQQARLRVRLYARLSKDDGDADKESNSITNQLQMLRYYSKEKGFEIIDEYVDDGYSGTTFNRPDLNRMIEDAMEDTQPSGIMVKDMSRFGRNNAMFMYYVEEIFPNNDILFIALNDDVDTRYEDNEMMPFKSIMNEYYARDTSKKIRSVKCIQHTLHPAPLPETDRSPTSQYLWHGASSVSERYTGNLCQSLHYVLQNNAVPAHLQQRACESPAVQGSLLPA